MFEKINLWNKSQCRGVFSQKVKSISEIDKGPFKFSTFSCVSFGKLYLLNNLHILSEVLNLLV